MNPRPDDRFLGGIRPATAGWCVLVLVVCTTIGCGIKGPPVPAGEPPLAPVTDLSYRLDGPSATLTWRWSQPLTRRQSAGAAFGVYRSRTDLAEPDCDTCPSVFERVATVPYGDGREGPFTTTVDLAPGYRFLIKVRMETGGQVGAEAGAIRIDVPADAATPTRETP